MFRLCIAERGAYFPLCLGPDQAGDLSEDVDESQGGATARVEEVDLPVVAATARGQKAGLPGRERDGFDGCRMLEGVSLEAWAVGEEGWSCGGWWS